MSSITIYLKDGTKKEFPHEGRAGGSYTKRVYYEGMFVIIKDEWEHTTAFPIEDVKRVETSPNRYG